ncbi:S ribonuclease [Pyrus ussuriensis x Pyrus communis]|uniref:S ribonuclease n=1 Tax=Pyrus ussuriensis x Pyrus communis TaxID=2448454 RepID=A0A5N5FTJ8_9ROSA|nr:S ribonuclease [Pyrus ussuriensis x Pyrus communis]
MSSSDRKSDEYLPPLFHQGGSSDKVGYFKVAHVKINSDELFQDFLEAYKHVIPSGVRVKWVKDDNGHEPCAEGASAKNRAIKFHPYYFVLRFTFPMPHFFQEVICSMKCAPAQCFPNAVRAMVGFSNLSSKCDNLWPRDSLEVTLLLSCVCRLPLSVLLSPLRREKGGLPPREEIKQINDEALARPIVAAELAVNGGGKKRSCSPAYEPSVEKKPRTSSTTLGSSSAAEKLVIDLTSPKGVKMTVEPELMKPTAPKKYPSGAKSGSASERLAAMKNGKVDFAAKVASGPAPPSALTYSSTEKGKPAHMGSCEKSTESEAEEFPKVCTLLKADLLKDVDACAKFVDSVGKVIICLDSFANHHAYSMRSSLIATMYKTLILATKSMGVDQDTVKCTKEAEVALVAQLRSAVEKIKKFEYELTILKASDVFAPTSLQLEIVRKEAVHLNTRLGATQAMLEAVEKEISCVSPVVEDLERVNSELRSACFTKDEELIFMHAEVSHLKEIASKLESKEVDWQGALSVNVNLKNELDKLQGAHTGLVEENAQLKIEKVGHKVALTSCQADFYKLGYVNHLQGRPSDYEFSENDFETFSISPVHLLDFLFEAALGGAVQLGATEDKLMEALATWNGTITESVAVEEPLVAQTTKKTGDWLSCFSEAVDPMSSLRF